MSRRVLRGRGRPSGRGGQMSQGRGHYQGHSQGHSRSHDQDYSKVTLEQRSQQQGIGRGCTVETSSE